MHWLIVKLYMLGVYFTDFAFGYPKEHCIDGAPGEVSIRHTGGLWTATHRSSYRKRRASWVKTNWRHGWKFVKVPEGYERFLNEENYTEDLGTAIYNLLEGERLIEAFKRGRMNG